MTCWPVSVGASAVTPAVFTQKGTLQASSHDARVQSTHWSNVASPAPGARMAFDRTEAGTQHLLGLESSRGKAGRKFSDAPGMESSPPNPRFTETRANALPPKKYSVGEWRALCTVRV